MPKQDPYSVLAKFYDTLADLVFDGSLYKAQTFYLNNISKGSRVLVLGGGTGRWLSERIIREGLHSIQFVDSSRAMIRRAREYAKGLDIEMTDSSFENFSTVEKFDAVVAFCFLDLFDDHVLPGIVEKMKSLTRSQTVWLIVDFEEKRWWQRALLRVMYFFFSFTTGLRTKQLPRWRATLLNAGLHPVYQRTYGCDFICTSVWKSTQ